MTSYIGPQRSPAPRGPAPQPQTCSSISELFPASELFPSLNADRHSPQLFAAASELLATTSELPRRNLRAAHYNLSRHTVQPSHTHPWTSARGNDIVVTPMLLPHIVVASMLLGRAGE